MSQPNILLITNDQHRYDFYEGGAVPSLRAPNLARLRRESTELTHAFTSCPLCTPARFTWLYGLRASQANGPWGEVDYDWPTHLNSSAHALQNAGYHTALIGKLHSHRVLEPLNLIDHEPEARARGFHDVIEMCGKSLAEWFDCNWTEHLRNKGLLERYRELLKEPGGPHRCGPAPFEPEDAMDAVIGDHAERWLSRYAGDKPFFLHASFCNPHFPYDPPQPYFDRYKPEDMPEPVGCDDPQQIRNYQKLRAAYCGLIEHCDAQIGRLLDVLDQRGLAQDTLVIFTTDHGDMMGQRDMKGKHQPYDASARTPVFVRWPGRVAAGRVLTSPAESLDLPCTLLEAAGWTDEPRTILPGSPGKSYLGYVTGQTDHHREWAYSEMGPWKMCCDERWKFVHREGGEDELFDRENDPHEQHNLADDPAQADRVSKMRRRIIASMSEVVAPPTRNLAGKLPA